MQITKDEKQRLLQALAELKQEHREMDLAIGAPYESIPVSLHPCFTLSSGSRQ